MTAAGLWKPHRRKARRPHLWRPRRSRRGELVQWDTSEHDWLEGRGDEKLYLIGMIDDASSELLARFVRHDSSHPAKTGHFYLALTRENFLLIRGIDRRYNRGLSSLNVPVIATRTYYVR